MIDAVGHIEDEVFRMLPRTRHLALDPNIVAGFIRPDHFALDIGLPKLDLTTHAVIGQVGTHENYLFVGSDEFIYAGMLAAVGRGCPYPDLQYRHQFQRRREREHLPPIEAKAYPEILAIESMVDGLLSGARAKYISLTHTVLPSRPDAEAVRQAVTRYRANEGRAELEPGRLAVAGFCAAALAAAVLGVERNVETPAGSYRIVPAPAPVGVTQTLARMDVKYANNR